MRFLFSLKNKIEDMYVSMPMVMGYIVRFVMCILAMLVLRTNIGFNEIMSNIYFVVFFSIACSFLPIRIMLLALIAYSAVQIFSLSAGLGIAALLLFMIMYFIYFRFNDKAGYIIILMPLLCIIRLPILIPLVLAIVCPMDALISSVLGIFVYYFLHYLHMNTAVFQGFTDGNELTKISVVLTGIVAYKELWYMVLCIAIMFMAAFFLKKINLNMSNQVAIAIGSGIYLILIITCNLLFSTMTYSKLIWLIGGTVVSCILAMIICAVILPLDYNRTELLEFEDEEYKYFVRAVPKAAISKETVKIKRIYSRKEMEQPEEKE